MLSAFTVKPLVELKQRDKSKIESLLVVEDRLLVGFNSGSLRVYRINEPVYARHAAEHATARDERPGSQAGSKPVELLRELEKFSKYRIEHLSMIEEVGVLVSLSNGLVHLHDLHTYELKETLAKSKGASTLSLYTSSSPVAMTGQTKTTTRLCVAVKRKLLIWTWADGSSEGDIAEITLATGIKSITWITSESLVAGLSASYCLVDVKTSKSKDIIGPGSIGGDPGQDGGRFGASGVAGMGYLGLTSPKPLATKLREDEVLLAKDINTLFIDLQGQPLNRRQVPWAVAPESVGYSYPYLLALQATKGTLEVRSPETFTVFQTLQLQSANQIWTGQNPNHRSKNWYLVSGERAVWLLQARDYDLQISELVQHGQIEEAIKLLELLDDTSVADKTGRLREIKMQKAQLFFDDGKFRDAIDLFAEINAPPEKVISLYPPFIAGHASRQSQTTAKGMGSPSSMKSTRSGSSKSKGTSDGPLAAIMSLGTSSTGQPTEVKPQKSLEGNELKIATEELRGFLVSARTKLKRVLKSDGSLRSETQIELPEAEIVSIIGSNHQETSNRHENLLKVAKLVDTTLFRAYMFVSPSFAGPLFRIDNFCDPEVVKEKLLEAGRYNDLLDFFYGKKLHRDALELMERFGKKDHSDVAPQLAGPQRTVAYLQNLTSDMADLILQFAEWPLRKDPELAMEIFLGDTENAETLPRERVVDFLESVDETQAVKYLAHIIEELNDTTPAFHQKLADTYVKQLKKDEFNDDEAREQYRAKAIAFLNSSDGYQPYKILGQTLADDPKLYEIRAIILSKMGQHKQALEIYVFKLKDPEKAEDYCNQVYLTERASSTTSKSSPAGSLGQSTNRDDDDEPSIYHALLALYLEPPPPHEPQLDPAISILARHGARMPAGSTLELIPERLPVKELESYFRGHIPSARSLVSGSRIVSGMRNVLAVQAEEELRLGDPRQGRNQGRNRRVVIDEERACGVCHKRFGGSAIKVLPDNTVVHYGCSAR